MKVRLAFCAQSAVVDRFSNDLSIFNVKTRLKAPSFPVFVPEIVFITLLKAEKDDPSTIETKAKVSLNGKILGEVPVVVKLVPGTDSRQIVNFRMLPIAEVGTLTFCLSLQGLGDAIFEVEVTESAAKDSAPVSPG